MTTTYVRLAGAAYTCGECGREHAFDDADGLYALHFTRRPEGAGKGWRYEEVARPEQASTGE